MFLVDAIIMSLNPILIPPETLHGVTALVNLQLFEPKNNLQEITLLKQIKLSDLNVYLIKEPLTARIPAKRIASSLSGFGNRNEKSIE